MQLDINVMHENFEFNGNNIMSFLHTKKWAAKKTASRTNNNVVTATATRNLIKFQYSAIHKNYHNKGDA